MAHFNSYIGIDYSGAGLPDKGLRGLRAFSAKPDEVPVEQRPKANSPQHWSRRSLAYWLIEILSNGGPTLVGIDHGFSFPMAYLEAYSVGVGWDEWLDDFVKAWPCHLEGVSVESQRPQNIRLGSSRWRRQTEIVAGAKSIFHFDVQGSVAKSTHAGLPWLHHIRQRLGRRVHVWPMDGFEVPEGVSVLLEAYPSLWKRVQGEIVGSPDQKDAYAISRMLETLDRTGQLEALWGPPQDLLIRDLALKEGWIFGVPFG